MFGKNITMVTCKIENITDELVYLDKMISRQNAKSVNWHL